MKSISFLFCAAVVLVQAQPLKINLTDSEASRSGWRTWSHRPATSPRAFVDNTVARSGPTSLAISGKGNAIEHGGWEYDVPGVAPNKWYRFTAYYRFQGVEHPAWQIVPRIDWRQTNGKRASEPEYVYQQKPEGDWIKAWIEVPAPERASIATLQLFLSHAPHGTIWWDDVSFEEIPPPPARKVRVATVNLRPAKSPSREANVEAFVDTFNKAVQGNTDIILFPEGMTVVGTAKPYVEIAESIPGPTTKRLGELAKERSSYIVAGLYESEGDAVYNTAVLIDRKGKVAGKYRKVYLPREEYEAGLTPGNAFPIFDTDFGRIGIMICYDVFFGDPAKSLAMKGAEVILLPIWGGDETLAKARAIENRIFLITSGYDHPTYIMDPYGERIAAAPNRGDVAVSTIDLARRYRDAYLGDMRGRRMKEQRTDLPVPPPAAAR